MKTGKKTLKTFHHDAEVVKERLCLFIKPLISIQKNREWCSILSESYYIVRGCDEENKRIEFFHVKVHYKVDVLFKSVNDRKIKKNTKKCIIREFK